MSSALFPGEWQQTFDVALPALQSPLGIFLVDLEVGGHRMSKREFDTFLSRDGAQLVAWNSRGLMAQVMICDVVPQLPSGMEVEACRAAVCRIRAADQRLD